MCKVKLSPGVLVLVATFLSGGSFVLAADVDLEKIVVTPYRYSENLGDVPTSVSVIDSEQIALSGASTTVGLLSDLSGVVVKDFTGNGSKATVDIRGFGEQAGLNVLVL
ncbi:MAG: TonB-dependent receptor plug domain-containing protein, partial [Candidatus Omnitrophota bacterium]